MKVGECKNDKDMIQALETLRQERLETRRAFETIWWNNIAFYSGDHYSEWNPLKSEFFEPKKEPSQVRLVINQTRVIARQEVAKVTKGKPIMEVVPRSDSETDIAATKVGKFVLDASEWKFKLRKKRRNAWRWAVLCGVGAVYVGYDPALDNDGSLELIIDPNTGEPTWNERRKAELLELETKNEIILEKEVYPLGDLEFKTYGPFNMLPDDTVQDWDEIKDIIVTDVVEVEMAKDIWPKAASELRADNEKLPGLGGRLLRRAGLIDTQADSSENTLQVHSYWLPPGKYNGKYLEDGKMVRWCNSNTELEIHDEFPFDDKRLPFAVFVHTTNPVSIWPDTTISDIRPINLELDKTISQLLENRDYMVNPMWLEATQSQVENWRSMPGGKVKYTAVNNVPPPGPVPGTALPVQVENLVVGLRDMILDVSGSGEVSRGRVPSGVRAGNMLAFLQEQDETQLGPVVEDFEDTVAYMGSLCLSRYGQFYTIERLMRNYKPGGDADVRKFKGADLKGNSDVMVQSGSALPQMKSAKQAYVMDLVAAGVETDPKKIKDWLELGEGEPDEVDLAYAQAERENELMYRSAMGTVKQDEMSLFDNNPLPAEGAIPGELEQLGGMVPGEQQYVGGQMQLPGPGGNGGAPTSYAIPVKTWHLHEAHIARHRRYMMMPEFERLVMMKPEVVRLFDEHVAMHEQILADQQLKQMQMMQAASGGPAGMVPPAEGQPQADAAAMAQTGGA